MTLRIPARSWGAAKALIVLTAAGLLLSGCHFGHRAYQGGPHYGGPHYAAPHHGKHYHHGKGKKGDYRHHRRGGRHGWR